MRKGTLVATLGLSAIVLLAASQPAVAQFYAQHNLISDGFAPADLVDPNLVNAWGLVAGPTTPWWISDNDSGHSTVYNVTTGAVTLTVAVPGNPTGVVFNIDTNDNDFVVQSGGLMGRARFLFASEDGTISGWSPGVNMTEAFVVAGDPASGAVYKGLAMAQTEAGDFRLYATNFHDGTVDVFDKNFQLVSSDDFTDPTIPNGYAPFGIRVFGDAIFVTYALQDADAHDDVPGEGHGYINMFDTAGNFLQRVTEKGQLNSPWGLAKAPDNFGKFSGHLLVGNFGNGRIHAFDFTKSNGKGEFQHRGPLHNADGNPIEIDGLWGLAFGNGGAAGPTDTLFFTAGPGGEAHGLFGTLVAVPSPGR